MTNRHRRVALQKQLRHRTPDNLAATYDARIHATNLNTAIVEQLHDARRRARDEHRSSHRKLARIHGMKAIDVFRRTHGFDDRSLVHVSGLWKLHQNPVDDVVRVQRTYEFE